MIFLNVENFLRTDQPTNRPTFGTIEAPVPELKNGEGANIYVYDLFGPHHLCVKNVCPPGDKQIVCPPGTNKRGHRTHGLTKRFIYIDFDIVAPPLTLTKTVPKSHQTDTWGLFHSGHICTKC